MSLLKIDDELKDVVLKGYNINPYGLPTVNRNPNIGKSISYDIELKYDPTIHINVVFTYLNGQVTINCSQLTRNSQIIQTVNHSLYIETGDIMNNISTFVNRQIPNTINWFSQI